MQYTLKDVNNIESLLRYCNDSLKWNIDEDYFDDIDELTYDFDASDLGIREEEFARINALKQIRPFNDNQEWAVFLVDFESKTLEVTALRKILSALVPKKSNKDHATWACDHIFFMCLWGDYAFRTIGFSIFEEQIAALPVLKIVYCTPSIESRQGIENFESRISFLECNTNENFIDRLSVWNKALQQKNFAIRSSQQLTEVLAQKALEISDSLSRQYNVENESGKVHMLFYRFKNALNIEFSEKEFMGMYAQTLVYGLFSARCMNPDSDDFCMETAIASIPSTNPLLQDLLKEFCSQNNPIDFDELDILELIDSLKNINIKAIMEDFNRQTGYGKEDPVIYFYEKFLDIFEKEQKKRCGVYYTPASVVDFMVRSLNYILKEELGYSDGFLDDHIAVFDPAVGTGTFLDRIIMETYISFSKITGLSGNALKLEWGKYVSETLLNRIYGFEFMMAPYSVAHMKLAMTLQEQGYSFPDQKRLQIYLANSLISGQQFISGSDDPLEEESYNAERVRRGNNVNVIIGSPPFHVDSKNQNEWIMALMDDYKREPNSQERLNERNFKLINDDYVKFVRLAEEVIKNKDDAVIAYIMPFSYASNLTFRGMRWDLLNRFTDIFILNLQGNVMGRDFAETEERDENVFDIQLGVCISFFVRKSSLSGNHARIHYAEVSGSRESKYRFLLHTKFENIVWQNVQPVSPYYFFKPIDLSQAAEYSDGISLAELFPNYLGGIKTHDDENLVSFNAFETGYDYLYDYRPFDIRHINYDRSKVSRDRYDIMQHMIGHDNLAIVIDRQVVTDNWSHIQIVKNMIDNRLHYSNRGIPVLCPMFIYEGEKYNPNINKELVLRFENNIGLKFSESLNDSGNAFDMMDLFDYAYGILNSPLYVEKYNSLLRIDFPRIPIPNNSTAFKRIVELGGTLRRLHLFELPVNNTLDIYFAGEGDRIVGSRKLKGNSLYINRTQFFANVTEDLWDFCFGGYHGLQKWLKDRNGMKLTDEDIQHVIRVFNIFAMTISIKKDIDDYMCKYSLI